MAKASDLAVLRGLSTYKARVEGYLGHAYSLYVGRPQNCKTEAVAIFYEIVYRHMYLLGCGKVKRLSECSFYITYSVASNRALLSHTQFYRSD